MTVPRHPAPGTRHRVRTIYRLPDRVRTIYRLPHRIRKIYRFEARILQLLRIRFPRPQAGHAQRMLEQADGGETHTV